MKIKIVSTQVQFDRFVREVKDNKLFLSYGLMKDVQPNQLETAVLAYIDEKPVGAVYITKMPMACGWNVGVFVKTKHRNKKIGRMMVARAKRRTNQVLSAQKYPESRQRFFDVCGI